MVQTGAEYIVVDLRSPVVKPHPVFRHTHVMTVAFSQSFLTATVYGPEQDIPVQVKVGGDFS